MDLDDSSTLSTSLHNRNSKVIQHRPSKLLYRRKLARSFVPSNVFALKYCPLLYLCHTQWRTNPRKLKDSSRCVHDIWTAEDFPRAFVLRYRSPQSLKPQQPTFSNQSNNSSMLVSRLREHNNNIPYAATLRVSCARTDRMYMEQAE